MRQSTVLRWLLVINIVGISVLLAFVFDVESQLEVVLEWIARHSWLGASLFILIYAASTGVVPSSSTMHCLRPETPPTLRVACLRSSAYGEILMLML